MTTVADPIQRSSRSDAISLAALIALGLTAVLVTGIALRIHDPYWNSFVLLLVLSGFIALAATRVAEHAPPTIALVVIVVVAVTMRLIVLSEDPILSTDIYRYVWDGRVQATGINPYRYVPADPALAQLRDAIIYPNIERADYATTIYPPVAQLFFFAVTRIAETLTAMRLALIGCEAVTLIVLIDLLRRLGKPVTLAVAYAWHPLAVWEVASSGHVDALMVTLVMVGVWLLVRHRRIAAGVFVALGALAKPYAIAALPACWRPWGWRLPLAVLLVIVACYLPYLGVGKGVFGFLLNGYLNEEGLQGGDGFWLVHVARAALGDIPGLVPLYLALAAATLGVLALRAAFARDDTPERRVRDIAMLLMVGLFFLSPNYPWYYLVVAAFIPLGGGAPAWAMSIGAVLLYVLFPDYDARFLIWKGVLTIAFLIAVTASWCAPWRAPSFACIPGLTQWKL